ncbi:ArgR family transcriptional regulator [Marinilabiliaceae bacterium ANBcel2]|nr:ArgR family transcriptional regulator [Marinilabiliaceae bacterium ANBcel2]
MKTKNIRLESIKELIKNNRIGNQEELMSLLIKKGMSTTQATLSRDLKTLKVGKQHDENGNYIYRLPTHFYQSQTTNNDNEQFPVSGILSINFSGNLAIVKTRPGFANGVASIIDSEAPSEILGTIAGDDTILLIIKENISKEDTLTALNQLIPGIKIKYKF